MEVKIFPYQPHCFAFGGFDMQMLNALESVKSAGVNASKLDIWSRENDFDIIHLWGIGQRNYHIIDWAKKSGKAVIATVLLPYFDTTRSKLSYCKHFFSYPQKELLHYYSLIDKIVVVNNLQSIVLTKYYKVAQSKIEVIPNIIEDKYFEIPTFNFSKKYEVGNYILCTGNISSRKNQYNLALACIKLNLNLVLIGNVLDGEISYGKSLESLTINNKNIKWIKELPKASEELVSAYHHCSVFALPSNDETQPISALEAMAMHKPIILMNKKYALQSFYKGAYLCKSDSVKDISDALEECLYTKNIITYNREVTKCKANIVGLQYKSVYENLIS